MKTINDIINQVIEITSERLNDKNVKFEEIGSWLNYLAQSRTLSLQEFETANKIRQISDQIEIEKKKLGINNHEPKAN